MLFRLATLGAIGYFGYKYLIAREPAATPAPRINLAGGPLSSAAMLQHSDQLPPAG